VLAEAIKKIGNYSFIFAGRQAIDGDTAQVGPQTAEKLGIPQITYTEELIDVKRDRIIIRRKIDGGYEIVEGSIPVLLTVLKDAVDPRPFSAKRVMAFKGAKSLLDLEKLTEENSLLYIDKLVHEYEEKGLLIKTLTTDDLDVDPERCGVKGSPTKVYKVESVVLAGGNHARVEPTKTALSGLIDQLMNDHIFG